MPNTIINLLLSAGQHSHTAILLLIMVIPGSIVFLTLIHVLEAGHTTFSIMFVVGYVACSMLQVKNVCMNVCMCVCMYVRMYVLFTTPSCPWPEV